MNMDRIIRDANRYDLLKGLKDVGTQDWDIVLRELVQRVPAMEFHIRKALAQEMALMEASIREAVEQ